MAVTEQLILDTSQAQQNLNQLRTIIQQAAAELNLDIDDAQIDDAIASVTALDEALDGIGDESIDIDTDQARDGIEGLTDLLDDVRDEIQQSKDEFGDLGANVDPTPIERYETTIRALKEELIEAAAVGNDELVSSKQSEINQIESLKRSVEGASDSFEELDDSADQAGDGVGSLANQIPALGGAMALLTNPIALAVAGLTSLLALGVEAQNVTATLVTGTGATGATLAGLEETVDNINGAVGSIGEGEIASVVAQVNTLLGVEGQLLEQASQTIIRASSALGEDAAANADLLSKAINAYGESAEDAGRITDDAFVATQKFGIGLNDLLGSATRNSEVFTQLGLSLEESIVLLGQFNTVGLDSGTVSTAFRTAISDAARSGEDLETVLERAQAAITGAASDAQAAGVAIDFFGERAGPVLAQQIRSGNIALTELSGQLGETAGATDANFDATLTATQELAQGFNELKEAATPLATALVDAVTPVIPVLVDIAEKIGTVNDLISFLGDNPIELDSSQLENLDVGADFSSADDFADSTLGGGNLLEEIAAFRTVQEEQGFFSAFFDLDLSDNLEEIAEQRRATEEAQAAAEDYAAAVDSERIQRDDSVAESFKQEEEALIDLNAALAENGLSFEEVLDATGGAEDSAGEYFEQLGYGAEQVQALTGEFLDHADGLDTLSVLTEIAAAQAEELGAAFESQIPRIGSAFSALDEDEGLDEFLQNQTDALLEYLAFQDNIQALIAAGATNLASQLATLGPQAAALAAEAVALSEEDLAAAEFQATINVELEEGNAVDEARQTGASIAEAQAEGFAASEGIDIDVSVEAAQAQSDIEAAFSAARAAAVSEIEGIEAELRSLDAQTVDITVNFVPGTAVSIPQSSEAFRFRQFSGGFIGAGGIYDASGYLSSTPHSILTPFGMVDRSEVGHRELTFSLQEPWQRQSHLMDLAGVKQEWASNLAAEGYMPPAQVVVKDNPALVKEVRELKSTIDRLLTESNTNTGNTAASTQKMSRPRLTPTGPPF